MENYSSRPAIPTELKRKILVEAGHRCAIPTCRNIDVDVHHITPWEKCKKHEYENLIALCPNCHRRAHKGDIDRKSQIMYKNNLRYIFDKYSQFEMDVLFALFNKPSNKGIPFPAYLFLLVKRIIDADFVQIKEVSGGIKLGNVKANPDELIITDKGKEFISSISNKDIGY